MSEPVVELRGVWKLFGSVVAVRDCSLSVAPGEFLSFLGPSGSGKTTTLRIVAGFVRPAAGEIRIRGRDVAGVPPRHRDLSMVFQNYALFPHLDVFENVAFGLRVRKTSRGETQRRVARALDLVQLEGLERRRPNELSGGQQQRVALARALVTEPAVLLLDEPLGALDRKLREELQVELKELLSRLRITSIYVTHDQDEALVLSDRVAVMNEVVVEQLDDPSLLYEQPRTRFVASFVGTSNLLEGTARAEGGERVLDTGDLQVALQTDAVGDGDVLTVAIRPEKVRLSVASATPQPNSVEGRVLGSRYRGASTLYSVELPSGREISATVANVGLEASFRVGEIVLVGLPAEHLIVLEGSTVAAPAEPALVPETELR